MEKLKSEYGVSYRNMMSEVKDAMKRCGSLFPTLKGKTPELTGFVWFQGWNDQYGGQDEYASNMRLFIQDVRKDLGKPKLPFVIAAMGQNGSKPAKGAMLTIREAQLSMNDVPFGESCNAMLASPPCAMKRGVPPDAAASARM